MKVLMVCLGNICRSPLAEGILQAKVNAGELNWHIDSAGTSGWHAGEPPDRRSIQIASENGIDISSQRSRQLVPSDLDNYDLILAMDVENFANIQKLCTTSEQCSKVKLILNYLHPGKNQSVPDPYFGGGFDYVYELLDRAIDALVETFRIEMIS